LAPLYENLLARLDIDRHENTERVPAIPVVQSLRPVQRTPWSCGAPAGEEIRRSLS
jgi:hypothetical protein